MALNNKDLERAKKLVQEINAEYAKMGKAIRFPEPTFETSIADLKQIQDIYDDINQSIEESTQATRDLEAETKELFELQKQYWIMNNLLFLLKPK